MRPFVLYGLVLLVACRAEPDIANGRIASPGPAAQRVDNVILITIDTLRADVLGTYGGAARTPVLDRLAARGWTFERCFSASMLTNPSHASIMTSLYPRDHGVYDNESGIADNAPTLAAALKRHGMRTAAIIGFPHLNPGVANLGQGFDTVVEATRKERRAGETAARALELLDHTVNGERFFMWVHIVDPHSPYEPPDDHPPRPVGSGKATPLSVARRAAPGFQRNNPWFQRAFAEYGTVEQLVRRYVAEVEATDAGIGTLVGGLEARGLLDETALLITSDHGENLGEHQLFFHHGGLYRETVHVPLIIVAPGTTAARVSGLVGTVDIAPTILELSGASRWQPMRGRSLVPVANGEQPPRTYVFSEHMLEQQVAVRSAAGTLIVHRKSTRQFPTYRFVTGMREAYDTRVDPPESVRLPAGGPLAEELSLALRGFLDSGLQLAARPAAAQDRESLRALGYVE